MTNFNNRDNYSSDRQPQRYADPNVRIDPTEVHPTTQATRTNPGEPSTVRHNAVDYNAGYAQGRTVEQRRLAQEQQARDDNSTANGVVLGILITAILGTAVGLATYLLRRGEESRQIGPVIEAPAPQSSPAPVASPSPIIRERVIERDRVVPVPQPQSPAVTQPPQVNVQPPNVTVPPANVNVTVPPAQAPVNQPVAPQTTAPTDGPVSGDAIQPNSGNGANTVQPVQPNIQPNVQPGQPGTGSFNGTGSSGTGASSGTAQ